MLHSGTEDRSEIQLDKYHVILENILHVLSLHESGVSLERLARSVAQTTPPEFEDRMSELRRHVKNAVFDLKLKGEIYSNGDRVVLRGKEKPSFREAARSGDLQSLNQYLAEGILQNEKDEALISALINNQVTSVKLLIDAGADVNARDNLFGKTPMMYVTKRTEDEIVQLLREAGAVDS